MAPISKPLTRTTTKLKVWIGLNTEPSDEFEKLALDARRKELEPRLADPANATELLSKPARNGKS